MRPNTTPGIQPATKLVRIGILAVAAWGISACGAESVAQAPTTTAPAPASTEEVFQVAEFTIEGGCGQRVFAANSAWTQVVEIEILDPKALEAGVPTVLSVGEGITARLIQGEKMSNLFCNDVLEGDEKTDVIHRAVSGSVTVTLDDPYDDSSQGIVAQVTTSDLAFATGDQPTSIGWLDITAAIGWYPG